MGWIMDTDRRGGSDGDGTERDALKTAVPNAETALMPTLVNGRFADD